MQQLCQMFEAASSPDRNVQQQVMQCLDQFGQMPDFNMYLVAVFAQMPGQQEVVRQRAGLLLKTNVLKLQAGSLQPAVAEHINSAALAQLQDASRTIRSTSGSILTTMVQKAGLSACGQTLERLVDNLGSQSHGVIEGSLSALSKVAEDQVAIIVQIRDNTNHDVSPATQNDCQLFVQWAGQRLIPKMFEIVSPNSPVFARQSGLECLNHFATGQLLNENPNLKQFCERYIEVLGTLANDSTPEVLKEVCKGFASVVENSWSCLQTNHYDVILNFMLKACQNPDYNVRHEALAVWSPAIDPNNALQHTWGIVSCLLPQLVPVLLANMIYSDADYMSMEASHLEDDNAAVPDSLDDIKPRFHKEQKNLKDGEDDDDDANAKGGAWGAEWTVRKAAASSLDRLSTIYSDEMPPLVLPQIEQKLQHSSWEHQEVGVLAMGAIAAGCMDKLTQFLPKVVELLISLTANQKPLVRSISCWCLSRFANWMCLPATPNREQILGATLKAVLPRVVDRNKRVQEAACSALATLVEATHEVYAKQADGQDHSILFPFLDDIVKTLVQCFGLYQTKNFRVLYDAIGTLAWVASWDLDKPKYVEAICAPVMHKFETVPDNDVTTMALFECCSNLVQYLRHAVLPIIPKLIQRCMKVIVEVARATQLFEQNPNEYEQPDSELLAGALDLLAGIIEGLLTDSGQVVAQHNFLAVLPEVLRCKAQRVKQSCFALMGSAASNCIEQLIPHLPQLLPLCANGLDRTCTTMVSHNSSWAVGEICIRVPANVIEPHLDAILVGFAHILNRQEGVDYKAWQRQAHRALLGNICITIGRLASVVPDRIGRALPDLLPKWAETMKTQKLDREKVTAFEGMAKAVQANPMAGAQNFPALAGAVSTVPCMEPLKPLQQVLHGYKAHFGQRWPEAYNSLAPDVKQRLQVQWQLTL